MRPSVAREFAVVAENVYGRSVERFMIATGRLAPNARSTKAVVDPEEPLKIVKKESIDGDPTSVAIRTQEPLMSANADSLVSSQTISTLASRTTEDASSVEAKEKSRAVIIPTISSNASEFVNSISRKSSSLSVSDVEVVKNPVETSTALPVPVIRKSL